MRSHFPLHGGFSAPFGTLFPPSDGLVPTPRPSHSCLDLTTVYLSSYCAPRTIWRPNDLKMPRSKPVEPVVTLPATSHHSKDASHVETLRQQFLARHDPSIMLPEDQRLSLEWKNITYKLPIIKRSFGREISRTDKTLLDNISGFLPAGSLLVCILYL